MNKPIPVLFTHYGEDWIRGSEALLLDLLAALDKRLIQPVVWCNAPAMEKASREAGYPTYRSDFHYYLDYDSPRLSPRDYAASVRMGRSLCREHGIRVLHANSAAPVQFLVPIGFSERLPVLAHLHIDYLRRSRYALLLHAATLIVGVSRQVNDGPIADGMAPERTKVIYNDIDFSRLPPSAGNLRGKLGIADDAPVITTAGSLIERKGHDVLLRAFQALPERAVKPHLLIPSDGPVRESLKALAGSLGVADRVHFLGYIDNIPELYQTADVFALASRGDAFGLVLAEAGHFRLPAVSTRVGGIPEVVLDGETGLLVPPDDVPALSAALARLLDDKELRLRLGAAAAERVDRDFTVERMARQFEETYASLAAIPRSQLGWGGVFQGLRPYARLVSRFGKASPPRYQA